MKLVLILEDWFELMEINIGSLCCWLDLQWRTQCSAEIVNSECLQTVCFKSSSAPESDWCLQSGLSSNLDLPSSSFWSEIASCSFHCCSEFVSWSVLDLNLQFEFVLGDNFLQILIFNFKQNSDFNLFGVIVSSLREFTVVYYTSIQFSFNSWNSAALDSVQRQYTQSAVLNFTEYTCFQSELLVLLCDNHVWISVIWFWILNFWTECAPILFA